MRSLTKYSAQFYCGLRFRLLLLMAVVCCPLVLLSLHTASEDRRRVLANWPQRAQRMAEFASGHEDTLISQTRQLLLALADSASVRWLNPPTCKELVDQLFASCPRYANLGVIKTDGEIVATALPLSGNFVTHRSVSGQDSGLHQTSGLRVATSLRRLLLAPHDDPTRFKGLMQARAVRARENEEPLSSSVSHFAQRAEESNPLDTPHTMSNWMALPSGDFFQRILRARAFAIGDFSFCRQSDPGTVCFGCPIFGALGQLQGVAFATLDRTRFNPFGSVMTTPMTKGATWAEFDANGKTHLLYPQSQTWTPELFEDDSVI